jgi:hypothetical protein
MPTFTAPATTTSATLVFSLGVTDDSAAASNAPDTVTITVLAGVTVSGRITFDRIPLRAPPGLGLDYAAMRQDPARGVLVNAIDTGDPIRMPVVGSTMTDTDGRYSVVVPANMQVAIRAEAQMVRAAPLPPPHYRFRVRDLDLNRDHFGMSPGTQTGAAGGAIQINLNITSGWTTAGLPGIPPARFAAPFAILDTVYDIVAKLELVAPAIVFPDLVLDWAETNPGGETFYDDDGGNGPNRHITIAAEPNVDTDEYDVHVLAHEFGHYLEDRFARDDSIGGPHGAGDRLDPRVAFSEGFGYAFSGAMLDTPRMRDTIGVNQAQESFFNIESDIVINPGWYSEASVHHILWDLYDSAVDPSDNVALGFAPLWQVFTNGYRTTDAFATAFSFVPPLKQANLGQAAAIDTRVAAESIVSATMDAFASTETNNAGSANVLPVYTPITVGGGARTVTSINQFGGYNGLSVRRFLTLTLGPATPTAVRITVTAPTPLPTDPDLVVWRQGQEVAVSEEFGNEDFTITLVPLSTYVLEVYDFDFLSDPAAGAGATPITVTVTQQ